MPDHKFIDLAYSKAEAKEEAKEYAIGPSGEAARYPWGLCIRLEGRELDKLGIRALPGVGDEYHMAVIAKVTQVMQQSGPDEDDHKNVAMQITMIEIMGYESASEEKAEEKKYGPETAASESKEHGSLMARYRS